MNYADIRIPNLTKNTIKSDVASLFLVLFKAGLLILSSYTAAFAATPNCNDTNAALDYWRPIKEDVVARVADANILSSNLLDCLGSTNSELRDGIAYELLTHWLRNDALNADTQTLLLTKLTTNLLDSRVDASLSRSFSALILAELMRADAQTSFMADVQRDQLLVNTIHALEKEHDFRGLDIEMGWIHPVAHLSDLLWRFTLHPNTNSDQIDRILDGVATKVAPTIASYHFNESDRLARVVSTIIRQSKISDKKMTRWLMQFETPRSMEKWSHAFRTPAGMSELHNTKQFLRALSDQLATTDAGDETSEYLQTLVQGFTQLI